MIEYIASNIKSNIRELEGALNKIIAYANLEKREINIDLVRAGAARHHLPERRRR